MSFFFRGPPEKVALPPFARWTLKATWLSQKPKGDSALLAIASTLALALGSSLYWSGALHADQWMPASGEAVFARGEYWRLWTTIFAHGDLGHLLSNSFLFFILGFFLFGYFGWRLFPLSALVWGGLANWIALKTYDPKIQLIGASGVVYWMGGTWLILYFFLSRQKNLFQRWLRTLGVAFLLFMPAETFEPAVSYRTHLIGFILGLFAGTWHFYRHLERFRSGEIWQIEIDEPDPEDDFPPPEGFPPIAPD